MDVDFQKYSLSNDIKVPSYYSELFTHFNSKASDLGLNVAKYEQVEAILRKR